MGEIRIKLPTFILLLALVAGGSFAAGSALPTTTAPAKGEDTTVGETHFTQDPEPPDPTEQQLPPGHPPVDDTMEQQQPGAMATGDDVSLEWKAPARWQLVPNTSSMRIATYRVPHSAGDAADAELSITRAGGSADANAQRWIGQFADDGTRISKRTTRKVGLLEVSVVEVQGTYAGGMGKDGAPLGGWALLGAIVPAGDTPYFFKLTGPVKSVLAAHGEFDAFIGSLSQKRARGT
ncbi:MAG TPA: hypothetical protein VF765_10135 [Polyangiaceae bacterium]